MEQTRKQELQEELNNIRAKEIEAQLIKEEELNSSSKVIQSAKDADAEREVKLKDVKSHNFIMRGDFFLKFFIAVTISAAFIYSVISGVSVQQETDLLGNSSSGSHFQIISVLGPLFGAIIQYYFGKNKAGSNGE